MFIKPNIEVVLNLLSKLEDGSKPLWGEMSAQRMVEHLADSLKVSNGNVTGIIDRLVQEGHVERIAIKGDRRAYLASLTEKGSKEFQKYALEHEMWINELLSDISLDDAKMITSLLSSISEKEI